MSYGAAPSSTATTSFDGQLPHPRVPQVPEHPAAPPVPVAVPVALVVEPPGGTPVCVASSQDSSAGHGHALPVGSRSPTVHPASNKTPGPRAERARTTPGDIRDTLPRRLPRAAREHRANVDVDVDVDDSSTSTSTSTST